MQTINHETIISQLLLDWKDEYILIVHFFEIYIMIQISRLPLIKLLAKYFVLITTNSGKNQFSFIFFKSLITSFSSIHKTFLLC